MIVSPDELFPNSFIPDKFSPRKSGEIVLLEFVMSIFWVLMK